MSISVLLTALALASCGGSDPIAEEASNDSQAAEVDVLPPDESVATPSDDLANGAAEGPQDANAVSENSSP